MIKKIDYCYGCDRIFLLSDYITFQDQLFQWAQVFQHLKFALDFARSIKSEGSGLKCPLDLSDEESSTERKGQS